MVNMHIAEPTLVRVRADGDVRAFPTHLASAFHPEPVRFFERGYEAQAEGWLRKFADRSVAR